MAATWTAENGGNNIACYLPSMQNASNGKRVRGFVSYVVDTDHFYLQFVNELPYAAMSAELQSEYDTDIMACLTIDQLREGQAYATLFNGVWFRILLEKLLFNGNCLIFFVDSGHRKTAPLDEIFLLNPKFLKLPAQAVLCEFYGVQPVIVKDAVFQEERMLFLKSLIKNSKVIASIDNIIPGKVGRADQMEITLRVTLFTDLQEENIDGKLISSGYYVEREPELQRNELALVNQSTCEHSIASNYSSACSTSDEPEPMETNDENLSDQLVAMRFIVDPSHFYVQRKSDEDQKNKIRSMINAYYQNIDRTALTRLEIRTAEYYAILCPTTNLWYRSRCVSLEDSLNGFSHDYFLIDEGYTLRIFKNSVRPLAAELLSFPPLALGCRLDMDIPEGGWTSGDVETFKKLTEKRTLRMKVLRNENDILSVDLANVTLVSGEEGFDSVRNRLQRNRTSRTLHFKFYEAFSGARIKGRIFRVYNPYHLYFEPETVDTRKFSAMIAQLQVDCSVPVAASCLAVDSLHIGQAYAALHPNGRWGRAILEDVIESNDLVTVLFVDYGDLRTISRTSLRQLRERFFNLPIRVARCKLGYINSLPRGYWTKKAIADFKDLLKGSITVKVIKNLPAVHTHRKMREPILLVKIFSSGEKSSVNSILVDTGHAEWIKGSRPGQKSTSPQMKRLLPPRMRCHTFVSSRMRTPSAADFLTVDALAAEVRKLECLSRTFVQNERTKTMGRMPQSGDYVMSVRFLMCQSPEEIFFRPVLYDSRFEHLQAQLQISYRNVIRQTPCFKPGTWCTAYVYGQWIRAAILDFDENLQCSISSLDTGQLHRISVDQIYPLVEPYGSIPRLAIKCALGSRPQITDDANAVSKISNALLLADEIFIYCRQRPRAISSNMTVSVVFRRRSVYSDVFINLNEVLQSEKQIF